MDEYDEFDLLYADELDALDDFDQNDPESPVPKSKKTLDFKKTSPTKQSHDESLYKPLDSSDDSDLENKTKNTQNESSQERKRKTEDLPDIVHRPKKQKVTAEKEVKNNDNIQITPPGSPKKADWEEKLERNFGRDILRDRLIEDFDYARRRVLNRIPEGDFFSATDNEGNRVYMSLKNDEEFKKEDDEISKSRHNSALLGTSYTTLLIEAEVEAKRRRAATKRLQAIERNAEGDHENDEENHNKPLLWVDKYSPKRYTDLLSDESTNRTLLHWLKLWDFVVFGKERRVKNAPKQKDSKKDDKKWKDKRQEQQEMESELDEHLRPFHKIAMLYGPPGLGKTTLAHVVAAHAGYNVIEINASDDRSVEIFKNKIESATQMQSVLGADPRPNCLVIDEIDGAPQPAINYLISVIKGENTGKKKKKASVLLRPVICICNDQYAPPLRKLREISLLLQFPETMPTSLAARLLEISRYEKLKTDLTALLALCEKTSNDVRSCVNTLQFVHGKKKNLNLSDIQLMSIGQKDAHKSLYSVWLEIFTMPKPKRRRYVNPNDRDPDVTEDLSVIANNNMSMQSRFRSILSLAQAAGEYEKVTYGLFENYLEAKFKDHRMEKVCKATEWLCFQDILQLRIHSKQEWTLAKYLPYLMVIFHLMFAANNPSKLIYPNSNYEYRIKLQKCQSLLQTLLSDMSAKVKNYLNLQLLTTELLGPLLEIIQPNLRPVNAQLYSSREKLELAQLVKVMILYNITYRQERSQDGAYSYVIEPKIDEVIKFPGMKQKRQMTYQAKQLIAREVEVEKMRQAEARLQSLQQPVTEPPNKQKVGASVPTTVPNFKKKLEAVAIKDKDKEKVSMDFFGRKVENDVTLKTVSTTSLKNPENKKKEKGTDVLGKEVWFHFKEGYSNAVRRNVNMNDIL